VNIYKLPTPATYHPPAKSAEDFPISRIGVFLSYLGTTPWDFHFYALTLHSEIRDVHQLTADVDYFFRAKKHSEIRDKQSYLVNLVKVEY
jgi:hypothetical protein